VLFEVPSALAMKSTIFWHAICCWLVWFWRMNTQIYVCRIWGSHRDGYEESYHRGYMPSGPLKVNRRVGGTCRLHLHGRRISQARNRHEAGSKQSSALVYCFALIFDLVDGGDVFLRNFSRLSTEYTALYPRR
jgi:hypothetical protein